MTYCSVSQAGWIAGACDTAGAALSHNADTHSSTAGQPAQHTPPAAQWRPQSERPPQLHTLRLRRGRVVLRQLSVTFKDVIA